MASSSQARPDESLTINADQRQNYERFRNLICDHVRERFGSTMGGSTTRATPEEIVEWLRQQSVEQLAQPVEQRQQASSGGTDTKR